MKLKKNRGVNKNKTMKKTGGIILTTGYTQESAFEHFINNCKFSIFLTSGSARGGKPMNILNETKLKTKPIDDWKVNLDDFKLNLTLNLKNSYKMKMNKDIQLLLIQLKM